MRTNIDIDDALMEQALKAGPYKTKKEAVEAGLQLLARRAAQREILKWEGKLRWEGDESIDWTQPETAPQAPPQAPLRPAQKQAKAQPAGKVLTGRSASGRR